MSYLTSAAIFVIQTVFDFAIGIFLARAMLIAVGAPFSNPLSQFVYRLTNPLVMPLRRLIPRWGKLDIASLLVAFVFAIIELGLLRLLLPIGMGFAGYLVAALANVINIALWIAFWAVLLRCILSFFVPDRRNPNVQLLVGLTEPMVQPLRRLLPAFGGLDLSCWVASLLLVLARILIVTPLNDLAVLIGS